MKGGSDSRNDKEIKNKNFFGSNHFQIVFGICPQGEFIYQELKRLCEK